MGSVFNGDGSATISQVVRELIEVDRATGWERVRRVIEVLERHFGAEIPRSGSLAQQQASLRSITAHPACPFSKTRLAEMLSAYAVYRSSPKVCSQLSPSHIAAVASLPSSARAPLLEQAVAETLSVRQLRTRVRAVRRGQGERRGRPPSSMIAKAAVRIENALLLLDEAAEILAVAQDPDERPSELATLLVELSSSLEKTFVLVHGRGDSPRSSARADTVLHG